MLLRTVLSIVALFLSLVLLVSGNALLGTAVALRLEIEGYMPGTAGLILALYSVGFVLGSIHGIWVVQRVGHIRAFAVFGALAAAGSVAHSIHISFAGWLLLRLLLGFSIAGLMLVTESWANARATAETRGMLLAIYMVLFFLASSAGQFSVALGDPSRHHLFAGAALLIVLSLVPLSITRSPAPELETGDRFGIGELWRVSEVGVAGAMMSGVALSSFTAVGPIYAYQMGLEIEELAAFMGLAILAAMALQWPVGYLSDYVPRRMVIVGVVSAAAGAGLLAAIFGGRSTLWLYSSVALFYGFAASIYPLCLALTHDSLPVNRIVPASATLLLSYGIGTMAGPLLGGFFVNALGPPGLFFFTSLALGLLLPVAFHSLRRQEAPPVEDQTHCAGIAPVSTPVIMELDLRHEEFQEVEDVEAYEKEEETVG